MSSGTIAVACCRRTEDSGPRDLYPDPDAGPLQAALAAADVRSELVSWDDGAVDWEQYSRVVVSSTWDSVDRPAQYLAWARRVAAVTLLVNGPAFIEWGIDKTHQRELEAAGVPMIPTVWVTPGQQWQQPDSGEFVVKPSVSAGARNTARYAAGDSSAVRHVRELLGMGQTVMVQDYQAATGTGGETDIVYFDGIFSHAVNKKFPLTLGRGVIERPWEHISWGGLVVPSPAQLAVAEAVFSFVRDRLGRHPAYGRVDLVDSTDDGPVLLELELIDPYLSLDVAGADAAGRLARAVLRA